ncbi:MAG: FHA domain-containing protein [Oscillospiraceae bacterium]|nr:FHA domain-containing protein [Oscillospiraceae bacterium]
MEAIKCNRGHYYDKALGSCPVCAAEGGSKSSSPFVTGVTVPDDIPATAPATGGFDIPATIPASESGFDVNVGGGYASASSSWDPDDTGVTMAAHMDSFGPEPKFDPIVGWLICIKGPNRGKDYRLHSGTNFIGRSKSMDVCLESDQTVSSKNHASVSYDDRGKTFYIQKGEVRNLIYLNGKPVFGAEVLTIYDRIEIGNTMLMFVPLCSDQFSWQNV